MSRHLRQVLSSFTTSISSKSSGRQRYYLCEWEVVLPQKGGMVLSPNLSFDTPIFLSRTHFVSRLHQRYIVLTVREHHTNILGPSHQFDCKMRYQNWDVLLFPDLSKIPLQEFKTSCSVIQDPGKRS
jgi:hypothetical protein